MSLDKSQFLSRPLAPFKYVPIQSCPFGRKTIAFVVSASLMPALHSQRQSFEAVAKEGERKREKCIDSSEEAQ